MKCKICGKRFIPKTGKVYRVKESVGVIASLATPAKTIECVDCPRCGVQHMLNIREDKPVPPQTDEVLEFAADVIERLDLWCEASEAGKGKGAGDSETIKGSISLIQEAVTEYMEEKNRVSC